MSAEYRPEAHRRARTDEPEQAALFEVPPEWRSHWWGMPTFETRDARPTQRIIVNFWTLDDVREFAAKLGVTVTPRTDTIWYPPDGEAVRRHEWMYRYEP